MALNSFFDPMGPGESSHLGGLATFAEMKKRGLSGAWMQWTPTEGAADAMYKKIGFRQTKIYVTFYKKIKETEK